MATATDEEALRIAFAEFGEIAEVQIVRDSHSGRSRGFGFVHFRSVDDAKTAKDRMHNVTLDGRPIRTDFSFSDSRHVRAYVLLLRCSVLSVRRKVTIGCFAPIMQTSSCGARKRRRPLKKSCATSCQDLFQNGDERRFEDAVHEARTIGEVGVAKKNQERTLAMHP